MNGVHLGAIDLNLLVALDALLAERSVTRAAFRIGITQSAASHALARELLSHGFQARRPHVAADDADRLGSTPSIL